MRTNTEQPWAFEINRRELVRGFALITAVLVFCHLTIGLVGVWGWPLRRLFHLGQESNLPTWFSSILWAFAALAAYGCVQQSSVPRHRRTWLITTFVLLILSCDEVAMIHENLGWALSERVFGGHLLTMFPRGSWPVTLGPFIAGGLVWLGLRLRGCLRASRSSAKLLALGLGLFLFGAAGLELARNFLPVESFSWTRKIEETLEETLELVGAVTILAGLLKHRQTLQERKCLDR